MVNNKTNSLKQVVQTRVDPDLWYQVKVLAATDGTSVVEVLDRALRREIQRADHEKSTEQQVA